MDFKNEIILENDTVVLQPLLLEHIDHLKVYSEQEPEIWEYALQSANGIDNLRKYIHYALESRSNKTAYPFIIFDKRSNQFTGSTRFYDFQQKHRNLSIGYSWVGKKFQGTGLNKNCKFLLLNYAFSFLNMERVEFRSDNQNVKSIGAIQSIGAKMEGVLRSNCISPTGRRNSAILSIIKDEWENGGRETLLSKIT